MRWKRHRLGQEGLSNGGVGHGYGSSAFLADTDVTWKQLIKRLCGVKCCGLFCAGSLPNRGMIDRREADIATLSMTVRIRQVAPSAITERWPEKHAPPLPRLEVC